MITAETLWLRGQTAQQTFIKLANYNSAFVGTAMVQAVQMSIAAPQAFWSAVGRAGDAAPRATVARVEPAPKPKSVKAKTPAPKAVPVAVAKPSAPKPAANAARPAPKAPADVTAVAPPETPRASTKPKPVEAKTPSAQIKAVPEKSATPSPKEAPVAGTASKPKEVEAKAAVTKAQANPATLDAPRQGKADDLTTLAGVGPKLAQSLNGLGIYHYDQIAGLNADGVEWLEARQKGFKMLEGRYDIVGQAKAIS